MAYTNSVESGSSPLEAGTTFTRGLMWAGDRARSRSSLATAFDYRWLKTLSWPVYALQLGLLVLTLAIGDGVGGSARWIALGPFTFQFSELAKILMIIVLANYLASRQARLDSLRAILGACLLVGPPLILVMLQPDLGTSLVFAAILAGMLWMSGASLLWLGGAGRRGRRHGPDRVDLRPARLPEGATDLVPRSRPGHPGLRLPALPVADRGRLGRAGSARA